MAMCWVKGVTFHMRRNTSVYCSGVERAMMITEGKPLKIPRPGLESGERVGALGMLDLDFPVPNHRPLTIVHPLTSPSLPPSLPSYRRHVVSS